MGAQQIPMTYSQCQPSLGHTMRQGECTSRRDQVVHDDFTARSRVSRGDTSSDERLGQAVFQLGAEIRQRHFGLGLGPAGLLLALLAVI